MRDRLLRGALFLTSLVLPLAGCGNPSGLDSIQISPSSQALTTGQTVQFSVTGTYGNASHTSTKVVSSGVTWASSNTAVVTVNSSGLATAVGAGSATVTASAQAFNGPTSSSATITVTSSGGGTVSGSIASVTITPSAQTISGAGNTVQFTAIGTTSSGSTVNLTNSVAWISSATSVATIGATSGLATSVSAGTSTISALYTDTTAGSTVIGTATLTVTSAASGAYTALTLIPSSQALSASGQSGNFIALATTGSGLIVDIDPSLITWQSSIPSVATVADGVATGVSAGTSTVTALLTNPDNSVVSATASVTVSLTNPPEPILSLEIIPSSITVNDYNLSGQFIAIATYSTAPYVRDVTNDSATTWSSSTPNIFPVSTSTGGLPGASGGIVTAEGSGNATIIAESQAKDGTIKSATATFNCPQVLAVAGSSVPPSCPNTGSTGTILLSTLTIYQRGLNTTNWEVTAPSATGTANVLHCGPGWTLNGGSGGSVCTATYPIGTTVTITSPAGAGAFGGWSSNCNPTTTVTANGPNTCQVTLTNDDVVGVIVN
ncbi:MAG: Ig-like domain-containing protein [Terracidiphilus sp.]|nr:Ig-like domain-containing protein [Terracidiphilus sp.]